MCENISFYTDSLYILLVLFIQIAELPESFSKLSKLKTLDLFCNRLREIPTVLRDLTSLVRLDIDAVSVITSLD